MEERISDLVSELSPSFQEGRNSKNVVLRKTICKV